MFFIVARILAVVALTILAAVPAQTDPGTLTISTLFPSQMVKAGETITISLTLELEGLPAQVVKLETRNVPEGWQTTFQGGSRIVRSVFVKAGSDSNVSLKIEVPDDAASGSNIVTVVARGDEVRAELPLELIVGESEPPRLSVQPELPVLKGSPTTTFSYRLDIKNDTDEDLLVSLESDAPQGLEVTFKKAFGSQELTSIPVKAGVSEKVDVSVRFDRDIPAGEYPIWVRALAGEASDETELKAVITGKVDLNLSAVDGRLSGRATAGQETPLDLVVINNGTMPATDVRLEASPPAQWQIRFEPEIIPSLAPGEQMQVKAQILPFDKAVAGDYAVTLRAVPADGSAKTTEFRITVVTSTLWGVTGLVLIAAALGVVALAVARFGRR